MTIQEIKRLESMFIVEMHAAERILRIIESGMEKIYRESKDYKRLVKKMGKVAADKIVKEYTHRVLSHDEQYNCGKLLEVCKTLHHYMDRLTAAAIAIDPNSEDKGHTRLICSRFNQEKKDKSTSNFGHKGTAQRR